MRYSIIVAILLVASCTADARPTTDGGGSDAGMTDAGVEPDMGTADDLGVAVDAGGGVDAATADLDGDGLADADELRIAGEYLPYLALSPTDACPLSGIVFRMRPHPEDAALLAVTMVVLYEVDCGAGGHPGDDEVFGMTIDPRRPAPTGILAIRAIAHQNTACEAATNCGTCPGLDACTTATRRGAPYPVIFASRNKHGWYMHESECDNACFFTNQCDAPSTAAEPMLLNVGEPTGMLTRDLTDSGLITSANGWTDMSLFHFDPWANMNFGGAGDTTSDLIDAAFLTPVCP